MIEIKRYDENSELDRLLSECLPGENNSLTENEINKLITIGTKDIKAFIDTLSKKEKKEGFGSVSYTLLHELSKKYIDLKDKKTSFEYDTILNNIGFLVDSLVVHLGDISVSDSSYSTEKYIQEYFSSDFYHKKFLPIYRNNVTLGKEHTEKSEDKLFLQEQYEKVCNEMIQYYSSTNILNEYPEKERKKMISSLIKGESVNGCIIQEDGDMRDNHQGEDWFFKGHYNDHNGSSAGVSWQVAFMPLSHDYSNTASTNTKLQNTDNDFIAFKERSFWFLNSVSFQDSGHVNELVIVKIPIDPTISLKSPSFKKIPIFLLDDSQGEIKENDIILPKPEIDVFKDTIEDSLFTDFDSVRIGNLLPTESINFVQSSPELLTDSKKELDKISLWLSKNKEVHIEVGGHTDNVGNEGKNMNLSRKRVEVVKNYLMNKGVEESQIIGKRYGGSRPISENTTEDGRSKNRRVTFTLVEK